MIETLKASYQNFSDAVIRDIQLVYPSDNAESTRKVNIRIDCRNVTKNYRWETLMLCFSDVSKFVLIEENFTNQIIEELKYDEIEGSCVFDFSYNYWTNIEELKKSTFYIICKGISFQIEKIY